MNDMKAVSRVPGDMPGFLAHARATGLPVYIFGADICGKIVREVLRREGVEVRAYLDNNLNKVGMPMNGVEVIHAAQLPSLDRNAIVLIASTYIADIIRQLEDHGFYSWVPISGLLKASEPRLLSDLLDGELRLNHAGGDFTKDFDAFVVENMINSQEKYLDPTKLFIRSVDLIVTERCSLKCKDCSNLMQYYDKPVNIADDELIAEIDDITAVADEINEIRIIGGDPMMNPNFHLAVAHAAAKPNVNKIVIYTNGVICPPEPKIAALAHEKVFVFITTYGELSRNNQKLGELLKKYDIPFNSQQAYGWTDCADIQEHKRTDAENEDLMRKCCAKHFTTLTGGKVFRCPFSANVERLAALPETPDNYVTVRGARDLAPAALETLRRDIKWYLREKPFISACDFCNGRTYGDPEITPGVQTKQPRTYTRFERTVANA